MSQNSLPARISVNSRKMLAYALIGYLQRLLRQGLFDDGTINCKVCKPFNVCGKCRPLYTDAFDIFGAPTIFDLASHPDIPKAIANVLLQIAEYEYYSPEILKATVADHIEKLMEYLVSEPENDTSLRRVIFKLLDADQLRG